MCFAVPEHWSNNPPSTRSGARKASGRAWSEWVHKRRGMVCSGIARRISWDGTAWKTSCSWLRSGGTSDGRRGLCDPWGRVRFLRTHAPPQVAGPVGRRMARRNSLARWAWRGRASPTRRGKARLVSFLSRGRVAQMCGTRADVLSALVVDLPQVGTHLADISERLGQASANAGPNQFRIAPRSAHFSPIDRFGAALANLGPLAWSGVGAISQGMISGYFARCWPRFTQIRTSAARCWPKWGRFWLRARPSAGRAPNFVSLARHDPARCDSL